MRKTAVLFCSLLVLWISAGAGAQGEIHTTVVSDDVLVIRGLVANMAVLRTDDGLVLVDSLISPLHARMARAQISERFPHQTIRYVINTHYHPDHNYGNQEYPQATIIAHANHVVRFPGSLEFAEKMQRAPGELERLLEQLDAPDGSSTDPEVFDQVKLWQKRLARYAGFHARTADIQLEAGATLSLGGKTISILHLGPGHTDGDLVVLFEEDRVLVTGDLVFRDIVPVIDREGGVDIEGWISALRRLAALGEAVQHVIPGHGDAGGRELLEEQARYFDDLWQTVREAHARGLTIDETKGKPTLDRYDVYAPLLVTSLATLRSVGYSWSKRSASESHVCPITAVSLTSVTGRLSKRAKGQKGVLEVCPVIS